MKKITALLLALALVGSLTACGDTYFPTSSIYDEGGYETATSFLKKRWR